MSTNVNVRVGGGQLPQQLKDQAAKSRFEAEKEGTPANPSREERQQQEAVAEAVRQVLDVQGDDGQLKLKKRRRQLAANREQSGFRPIGDDTPDDEDPVAPPEEQLADGIVPLARVGIRRNSNGTKFFVYPWGVEAALGRRLSSNYNTAVSEAFAVGTVVEFPDPFFPEEVPRPTGQVGEGGRLDVPGNVYDLTPYFRTRFRRATRFISYQGTYYEVASSGTSCYNDITLAPFSGRYDSVLEFRSTSLFNNPPISICFYYGAENGNQNPNASVVYKSYQDFIVPFSTLEDEDTSQLNKVYEIILPVNSQSALVVFIRRRVAKRVNIRFFWTFSSTTQVQAERPYDLSLDAKGTEVDFSVTLSGGLEKSLTQLFTDQAIENDIQCVVVTPSSTSKVPASPQLEAACDALVSRLELSSATGSLETDFTVVTSYQLLNELGNEDVLGLTREKISYTAFEASNLPKAPYYETPAEKQVLAKQFGMGYLSTNSHAGNFITPAIFDWFTKQPTLETSYASHISRYQASFSQRNKPFPGFYLSVPPLGFEGEEMTALILTTPQDITTPVTVPAPLSIEVETQSTFGDYLVWDWGNPEYCRERLTQLGMGFLF